MDRVRLGRALGYGARHAAKTLTQAIDAASAPGPSRKTEGISAARPAAQPRPAAPRPSLEQRTAGTVGKIRTTGKQAKRASGSLMQPLKRFSSVLWLEVSGTFFALIAVSIAIGTWRMHGMLHAMLGKHEVFKVILLVVVFLAFTYFAVSNFVRASKR